MITTASVTEEEIKKFHKSFKKLDEDKSGDLDPSEIFSVPGRPPQSSSSWSEPWRKFLQPGISCKTSLRNTIAVPVCVRVCVRESVSLTAAKI